MQRLHSLNLYTYHKCKADEEYDFRRKKWVSWMKCRTSRKHLFKTVCKYVLVQSLSQDLTNGMCLNRNHSMFSFKLASSAALIHTRVSRNIYLLAGFQWVFHFEILSGLWERLFPSECVSKHRRLSVSSLSWISDLPCFETLEIQTSVCMFYYYTLSSHTLYDGISWFFFWDDLCSRLPVLELLSSQY